MIIATKVHLPVFFCIDHSVGRGLQTLTDVYLVQNFLSPCAVWHCPDWEAGGQPVADPP